MIITASSQESHIFSELPRDKLLLCRYAGKLHINETQIVVETLRTSSRRRACNPQCSTAELRPRAKVLQICFTQRWRWFHLLCGNDVRDSCRFRDLLAILHPPSSFKRAVVVFSSQVSVSQSLSLLVSFCFCLVDFDHSEIDRVWLHA